jgi:hypothetical protein
MKIPSWVRGLFSTIKSYFASGRASRHVDNVVSLIPPATRVVKMIAAITPTRSDDEIIKLFETYGLPKVESWLALPHNKRGPALMEAGLVELQRLVPDLDREILRLALQSAFFILKIETEEQLEDKE